LSWSAGFGLSCKSQAAGVQNPANDVPQGILSA